MKASTDNWTSMNQPISIPRGECEHKWSAPVIAQKPIYNDFGVPISGSPESIAVISCEKCGEIKEKKQGETAFIKDYLQTRDLAIENAVRAELVEKIKNELQQVISAEESMEHELSGQYREGYIQGARLAKVIAHKALLTTSPSR